MTALADRVEDLLVEDLASNRQMHAETRSLLERVLRVEYGHEGFNRETAQAMARQCQRNHSPDVDEQFE